jgi:DNA replication protein DnaC
VIVGLATRCAQASTTLWELRGFPALLEAHGRTAANTTITAKRKKYFNVSYLVVDEVGFEPMSQQDASLFFRLVSYRYRRGSTAITTNKGVKDWPGLLAGDEAMAATILDRLLHKSVVLNVRGRSYRLQELEKVLK